MSLRSLVCFAALALAACNIEIGNPEPPQTAAKFSSLNLSLASYSECSSLAENCTVTPIILADPGDSTYAIEMTKIQLQLQTIRLEPYATDAIHLPVDLLKGTTIELGSEKESAKITSAALNFAETKVPTMLIQGKLRVTNATETFFVPILLEDHDSLMAQVAMTSPADQIAGFLFDANNWFDFSDSKPDIDSLIKSLTSGSCRNTDSIQCDKLRENLAKQISKKIAKSLSVKTSPASKNPNK